MKSPQETLAGIEKDLSSPEFMGIPLGPTLNDFIVAYLYGRLEKPMVASRILNPLRAWRYRIFPFRARQGRRALPKERVLVTWSNEKPYHSQLVGPVVDRIGHGNCLVMAASEAVEASLPHGLERIVWRESMHYDSRQWRRSFARVWPGLEPKLNALPARYGFPQEVASSLRLCLMLSSQYVVGCERFLTETNPRAIIVDFDRQRFWSVLVMVGRKLRIPTYTLVHGVLNDDAVGYVPILADKAFCWGEIDRQKFLAAGASPEKLIVAGCPRLQRRLDAERGAARAKAGLPTGRPLVLLATAPYSMDRRQRLASVFCEGLGRLDGVVGAVRLHPSEDLEAYGTVMARYPAVRFLKNPELTADEAIAAADAVVVHSSGFGSDALIKGCPVIVLDVLDQPLGHGEELIRHGQCAGPRGAEELAEAARSLLFDEQTRKNAADAGERFARMFCSAYGAEAAQNIAQAVFSHCGELPIR